MRKFGLLQDGLFYQYPHETTSYNKITNNHKWISALKISMTATFLWFEIKRTSVTKSSKSNQEAMKWNTGLTSFCQWSVLSDKYAVEWKVQIEGQFLSFHPKVRTWTRKDYMKLGIFNIQSGVPTSPFNVSTNFSQYYIQTIMTAGWKQGW